ncbi:hypothetical protein ACHAPT_012291 [Fusarium lateritium]
MHFVCRRNNEPECTLLPNIAGIRNDQDHPNPVTSMKALGVMLDHKLDWEAHTDYIVEKVLKRTRQIYLTKIRPIIFYACGAWALVSDGRLNWGLSVRNIRRLEYLQGHCLMQISGGISRTPRQMLEKELNIDTA